MKLSQCAMNCHHFIKQWPKISFAEIIKINQSIHLYDYTLCLLMHVSNSIFICKYAFLDGC